jgi:DNA modification methylase
VDDVTLLLGDCADRFGEIEDDSLDLILTSPPYDDIRRYGSGHAFDFPILAAHCMRTLKVGGVLVWVVADQTKDGSESGTSFRQALHFKEIGFRLHDTMIYAKANYVPLSHDRYEQAFEFMFVLSKGAPAKVNKLTEPCKYAGSVMPHSTHYLDGAGLARKNGASRPIKAEKPRSNIWTYGSGGDRRRNAGHPAAFPLPLAIDHVSSWTDPGDIVADPFMGSGTTAMASLSLGRRFIGCEIDPDYFGIATSRIAAERRKHALFAGG